MKGLVYQLNLSTGGIPKLPVDSITLTSDRIVGDDWNWSMYKDIPLKSDPSKTNKGGHGGPDRAICIYALECLERLNSFGFPVYPGALGENITTQGIDYRDIRIGDAFMVGDSACIRITRIRGPCGTINKAYHSSDSSQGLIAQAMWGDLGKRINPASELWGMTGFYAKVIELSLPTQTQGPTQLPVLGTIKKGDTIDRIVRGTDLGNGLTSPPDQVAPKKSKK